MGSGIKIHAYKKEVQVINKIQRGSVIFGAGETSKAINIDQSIFKNAIVKIDFNADGETPANAVYAITEVVDVYSWWDDYPDSPVSLENAPYQVIIDDGGTTRLLCATSQISFDDTTGNWYQEDLGEDWVYYLTGEEGLEHWSLNFNNGAIQLLISDAGDGTVYVATHDILDYSDGVTVLTEASTTPPNEETTSELQIVRMSDAVQTSEVFWEMVEYTGVKTKQTGIVLAGEYPVGGVVIDAIDITKSMLVYSFMNTKVTTADLGDVTLLGAFADSTHIEFSNETDKTIYWQVLEFK